MRALSDKAWADGITLGIHTLSNFIHTTDEYVTPVSHEKLLVMDETVLAAPLKADDTVIFVRDVNNFAMYDMNVVRLGDELIEYEPFGADTMCLTGCRRSGMHHYRVMNGAFFRRNVIPPMMGWYIVASADGKYEATTPENFEFAVSRSAAFSAGLAVNFCKGVVGRHGLINDYADLIRIWEGFCFRAHIPADVLTRLQEETNNWHLEKQGDGWLLTELLLRTQDLSYYDREIKTEAGMIYCKEKTADYGLVAHCSRVMLDAPYGEKEEKIHFRIRVGHAGHGRLEDLCIVKGFADEELAPDALRFKVSAIGGDYLEYRGENELYHWRFICLRRSAGEMNLG